MFFSCALLLLNSTGYAQQYPDIVNQSQLNPLYFILPKVECKKANLEDSSLNSLNYKLYGMFTYDAEALREQLDSDSIFTDHRALPFVPFLSNNFDNSKPNFTMAKQNNIYGNQTGFNAPPLPKSVEPISFYALVKDQSRTINLEVDVLDKVEPGDTYASKYYPMKSKYTGHGHILNLEARIELPVLNDHLHEQLQLIIFVDTSPITMEQNTWASELNQTTINGAGLGVNWTYKGKFSLQAYIANELEYQVLAIPPVLSQLFWVQAVKYF